MTSGKERYYRNLFRVAAVYDLVLGIAFVLFPTRIFAALGVAERLPEFRGYVTLLGAFVFVIGVGYYLVSRSELRRNADLVFVGALYKLVYCATAFHYWFSGELPHLVFGALFGVVDLIFFILMAECYWSVRREPQH